MGCSKSFKELLHIRNAAAPWKMNPAAAAAERSRQHKHFRFMSQSTVTNNLAGSIFNCEQSAYLGCLLTSSTKDNIEQITLHV
ncbi:unnamed protein product [Sphagnum troendelagicum]|uniref:Uncharacterized protein n=1 Tax=Sphagnum troendelagicum TaxID=128251 RepID=A0ABP0UIL5_9BRYO